MHERVDARAIVAAARKLLRESGSRFLHFGAENVHCVGVLMDETFGTENRGSPPSPAEIIETFGWHVMVELPDGRCRRPTPKDCFGPDGHLPKNAHIYDLHDYMDARFDARDQRFDGQDHGPPTRLPRNGKPVGRSTTYSDGKVT